MFERGTERYTGVVGGMLRKAAVASVVFVGEHPGRSSERMNRAFIDAVNAAGLPEWHVTNKFPVTTREMNVIGVMVDGGLAPSKSEARRLIQQGGVRLDGYPVEDILEDPRLKRAWRDTGRKAVRLDRMGHGSGAIVGPAHGFGHR